ncbi:PREDICTED: Fanconi anemia group J protein homolog [Polistes dominula]|uniref:Fanconi anemia group J protein homolog n=1 Tax=Polistes dominula TaxID=743375 RepID=A0ABM1IUB8_POLDO|nr:PREDICTED: Fanconi anemia group J protein homolog [Polistes dominula]
MDSSIFQIDNKSISINFCKNSITNDTKDTDNISSQIKVTYTQRCVSPEHVIENDLNKSTKEKDIPKKIIDITLEDSSIEEIKPDTSSDTEECDFTQRSIVKEHLKKTKTYKPSKKVCEKHVEYIIEVSKSRAKSPICNATTSKKPKIYKANPQRKLIKGKDRMDSYKFQTKKGIEFINLCEDSPTKDLTLRCEETYDHSSYRNQISKADLTKSTSTTSISSASTLPAAWKNNKDQCVSINEMNNEYLINGVKVTFPMVPYDAQKSVMRIVIKNCTNSTNCLIESPTGSGKTLALLCSVLAWQTKFVEDIEGTFDDLSRRTEIVGKGEGNNKKNECCGEQNNKGSSSSSSSSASDTTNLTSTRKLNEPLYEKMFNLCNAFGDEEGKCKKRAPKIYYTTRTHRQIKQVVKELGRTVYKNTKMTILSSREHTCIQDVPGNKTELCHNLLDPEKSSECPFYNNNNKKLLSSFAQLKCKGMSMPFDIEDIVKVGKKYNLCPYFGTKSLIEEADIIFCPYNYIIDPEIRESMQINLRDQVVIFDEGHNIEDICRRVAGAQFSTVELQVIIDNCKVLLSQPFIEPVELDAYNTIQQYVTMLKEFMNQTPLSYTKNSAEMTSSIWTGNQLIGLLEMNDIGLEGITKLAVAVRFVIDEFNKAKENVHNTKLYNKNLTISRITKMLLHSITLALKTIATQEYENDYKAYIDESYCTDLTDKNLNESWMLSRKVVGKRLRTFRLICLNPAIIFGPLARQVRSIILASGTLTPTESFESELGTKFADIHFTDHVISKDRVFVKCVPKGPSGTLLKANFTNVNTWQFQDELGQLILKVIEAVPHGILCFFSSYIMMNNQITRWKFTQIWQQIEKYKKIFVEPRESSDLKDVMEQYREVINETSEVNVDNNKDQHYSGAILFAVFRGKVAEGIDFSDDEARCVITIGIPYPVKSSKDIQMKWEYNDKNISRGLLRGSDWYNIQAFRAYNQAVGRCIRHKNDWGAILLVDERFLVQTYQSSLPKWTRNALLKNSHNENIAKELKAFVQSIKTPL